MGNLNMCGWKMMYFWLLSVIIVDFETVLGEKIPAYSREKAFPVVCHGRSRHAICGI